MNIQQIDAPIAERKLTMGNDTVIVVIGKPQPFEDGEYYCPYSIDISGKIKFSYAGGVDAVQALQLTMKKIGVDLDYFSTLEDKPITWLSDTGSTGFPV